jgi:hypothetical protein
MDSPQPIFDTQSKSIPSLGKMWCGTQEGWVDDKKGSEKARSWTECVFTTSSRSIGGNEEEDNGKTQHPTQ